MRRLVLGFACLVALGCGGEEIVQDAGLEPDAPPAVGTISLSWTISDGAQTVACGDVEGLIVSVRIVPAAGGGGLVEAFPCDDGAGTSQALDEAAYNLTITLQGSGGVTLGDPQTVNGVDVTAGADTPLGAFEFVVQ